MQRSDGVNALPSALARGGLSSIIRYQRTKTRCQMRSEEIGCNCNVDEFVAAMEKCSVRDAGLKLQQRPSIRTAEYFGVGCISGKGSMSGRRGAGEIAGRLAFGAHASPDPTV